MSELEQLPRPHLAATLHHWWRDAEVPLELWWFGDPCVSLLCYCSSVAVVLGLGLAGVFMLSSAGSATGPSALWRLAVGFTLCLLALTVLLKQLLSSAVQDMGCIRSRRRILQLRSGGSVDPLLLLATGLALMVCGSTLLLVLSRSDTLLSGTVLLSCGGAVVLAVVAYRAVVYVMERRNRRMRRRMVRRRRRRVRVYAVTGQQRSQPWRVSASSQASLI
ncbi:transmembrane protein 125 [Salminus brasiliensis]|uniref:transmembrane protein 125 n=1 Tax=Salminus brasiliensis TaxID=930266 RepID=UPI003B836617